MSSAIVRVTPSRIAAAENYNVLLIVADDLGAEHLEFYDLAGRSGDYAYTPRLSETWVDRWLRFENVWSAPICSPTRVSLMTGLYDFASGVGSNVATSDTELDLDRTDFLPKLLDAILADVGESCQFDSDCCGGLLCDAATETCEVDPGL